ncbi:MAG: radical SAM protein, partial [Oscillospiraceae bacterium]|nr:radical SAM protein [Oscillospiraceae bacterium]
MVKIFEKTKSVCPICLKPVDAYKVEREDGIYLDKQCPEHGMFRVLIWKGDQESYQKWDHPAPVSSPTVCQTEVEHGCPYDCGLCPDHEQQICCVVLEVTERCNLRCPVCFASAGGGTKDDPSQEEISLWYDRLLQAGGPYNIQLSGGEPTMRDDLPDLIRIGKEKGFT